MSDNEYITIIKHHDEQVQPVRVSNTSRIRFVMEGFNKRRRIIEDASRLISEDGENPEYDRGVSELLTEQMLLPISDAPVVLEVLREWRNR